VREVAPHDLAEQIRQILVVEWCLPSKQAIEGGTKAVDVAGRTQLVDPPGGLLRAHVGGRPEASAQLGPAHVATRLGNQRAVVQRRRGRCGLRPAQTLGQAPVDHQGLAVLAEHDVARLQVAVEDAPAVGVVDRVTDVEEPPQQLQQRQGPLTGIAAFPLGSVKLLDGRLEVVAADEPHRVKRAAVVIGPQAVDRHDAGVLEPAGDLGLDDEPSALVLVCSMIELDTLEGDDPMQLLVAGDVDLAESAAVVEADNAEAALGVGGRAFVVPIGGAVSMGVFVGGVSEAKIEKAGLEFNVGELLEAVADRGEDTQDAQAALGVEAVLLEVLFNQALQEGVASRAERALVEEDPAQGLGLVSDPCIEGGQESVAIDEVVPQGQQAQQQAVGRRDRRLAQRCLGTIFDAEGAGDGGMVLGEPLAVLIGCGRLAGHDAQLTLDSHQLIQERGAVGRGLLGQVVLDAWPLAAAFPVGFKAIGCFVDPGPPTDLGVAHGDLPRPWPVTSRSLVRIAADHLAAVAGGEHLVNLGPSRTD